MVSVHGPDAPAGAVGTRLGTRNTPGSPGSAAAAEEKKKEKMDALPREPRAAQAPKTSPTGPGRGSARGGGGDAPPGGEAAPHAPRRQPPAGAGKAGSSRPLPSEGSVRSGRVGAVHSAPSAALAPVAKVEKQSLPGFSHLQLPLDGALGPALQVGGACVLPCPRLARPPPPRSPRMMIIQTISSTGTDRSV